MPRSLFLAAVLGRWTGAHTRGLHHTLAGALAAVLGGALAMSGCDTAAPEADGGEREVAAVLDGDEEGVCYQCDGLRAVCPESKQGPATAGLLAALGTDSLDLPDRMAIVARSGVGRGTSASLHDYLLRFMSERTAAA